MRAHLSVVFLLALITAGAAAQRHVTLDDALRMALDRSSAAQGARATFEGARATVQAARRAQLSSIDLNMMTPQFSEALTTFPVGGVNVLQHTQNTQFSGGLTLTQPIVWTNTTVTLSGSAYQLRQQNLSIGSTNTTAFSNLSATVTQPLFIANNRRIALRQAEIEYDNALADYRRSAADIRFNVTSAFYALAASVRRAEIQAERVRQAEEAHTTAQNKFRAGLIAEVDALQLEVDLAAARNDALSASDDVRSEQESLTLLLGLPASDSLVTAIDTAFRPVTIDDRQAIVLARRNRAEIRHAQNSIESSELSLEQVESTRHIRADVQLSFGLQRSDTTLSTAFQNPLSNRSASLALSIPLFDWGRHGLEVEAAEASLQSTRYSAQNTSDLLDREIASTVRRVRTAAARRNVLSRSESVAEKAYDISLQRFNAGTVTSLDLAQAQQRLTSARLSTLSALVDYRTALADLMRRAFFDFETGKAVGEE